MSEIKPYRDLDQAMEVLDNGGHFRNLLAEAGDEVIDAAELAKAAGVISCGSSAFLYLEMALAALSEQDRLAVLALLAPELKPQVEKERPERAALEEMRTLGAGRSIIIEGTPVFTNAISEAAGYLKLPSGIGYKEVPLINHYNTYRLAEGGGKILVASLQNLRLPKERLLLGGVLKERRYDGSETDGGVYLMVQYYTQLQPGED